MTVADSKTDTNKKSATFQVTGDGKRPSACFNDEDEYVDYDDEDDGHQQ